nr:MAG TPA: Spi protease inhibitor [Bacteriophage sp.]DAN02590.1 MAG TPA: Spi protease inhibitor [Caudoviricetes sp.]DAN56423.1 MAG TPA: Spi protease inhibitor [Bacteriophage sp.]
MYYIVRLYNGNGFVILSIRAIHYTFYKLCFL